MPNRLATEKSRYLLQHKDNPVDWWSWGNEAVAESERTGKPMLLSIGYSSCHWCHVLAHESFEDPRTADVINTHFIPVKIDKEEYPDIDGYYMSFLNRLTGNGGWPLNVLTNSNLAPFYGFTYLPRDSLESTLLYAFDEYGKHERIRAQRIGTSFSERRILPETVSARLAGIRMDSPGTDRGPQFPQAIYLALALEYGEDDLVRGELTNLVTKGLFDHIEGGWFRYSVDPHWKVPHFEKMLYDQATLLYLCAKAYRLEPELCSYAITRTIAWLEHRMKLPNGLYGSATDADTPEGEGTYYTIESADSEYEAELFRSAECGIHEGRFLPWIDFGVYSRDTDRAESCIKTYSAQRRTRITPGLDEKAVFSWNAFLGYALKECAAATGDPAIGRVAEELHVAMDRIINDPFDIRHVIYPDGTTRGNRYLEDYAAYLLMGDRNPGYGNAGDSGATREVIIEAIERHFVSGDTIRHTDIGMFDNHTLRQDTPFPSGGSMLLNALAARENDPAGSVRLRELLYTDIIDTAVQHPIFFAYWISGYRATMPA